MKNLIAYSIIALSWVGMIYGCSSENGETRNAPKPDYFIMWCDCMGKGNALGDSALKHSYETAMLQLEDMSKAHAVYVERMPKYALIDSAWKRQYRACDSIMKIKEDEEK